MHPLNGPRLKIARAKSEIQRLYGLEEIFRSQAEYKVVRSELNPKTGDYLYRARIGFTPSLDEWGVWIGEIVHNLRSALDGLVYQLAILNGAPDSTRDTQFPVFMHRYAMSIGERQVMGFEGHRNAKSPARGSGRSMISLLDGSHQARIEQWQPYHRKPTEWEGVLRPFRGRRNLLFLLIELNNADKHRLIQVVGVKKGAGPGVAAWGDILDTFDGFKKPQIIKDGTVILEAPTSVHVDSELLPLIVFSDGCPSVYLMGTCLLLRIISEHVSSIVEDFAPEFEAF